MFDFLPTEARDDILARVRSLFHDHGHDLALAASLLGGPAAEARVVACALRIEAARRLDRRSLRDLAAMHQVLSLQHVGDPDRLETALFSELHPASATVEAICRLTDMLGNLLRDIDAAERRAVNRGDDLRASH
jgi:hypothetical protein